MRADTLAPHGPRDARRLERSAPTPRPGRRGLGRRAHPRAPSCPRAPTRSAPRWPQEGARLVDAGAHDDDALLAVHDPDLLEYLRSAWREWEAAGLTRDPGQDRVVPYVFAHAGLTDAPGDPGGAVRAGGLLRLRHDDPDRAGHVGGRAGGGRRGADRRRPRARGRARRLRVLPPPGSPRHARELRRLVLPEQHGRRRRASARGARRPGGGGRRRRPSRQRHPGDLLRRPRRARGLGPRRPGRGLVSALPRLRERDGRRREPQPAAGAGRGRRAVARGRSRARAVGRAARARSSSRSASTRPAAIPRARSR